MTYASLRRAQRPARQFLSRKVRPRKNTFAHATHIVCLLCRTYMTMSMSMSMGIYDAVGAGLCERIMTVQVGGEGDSREALPASEMSMCGTFVSPTNPANSPVRVRGQMDTGWVQFNSGAREPG
jgi:hypothetical protein